MLVTGASRASGAWVAEMMARDGGRPRVLEAGAPKNCQARGSLDR
jgi:hypothetical protein